MTADPEPALDHRLLVFLNGHTESTALNSAAELVVWACLWLGASALLAVLGVLSVTRRYTSALFWAPRSSARSCSKGRSSTPSSEPQSMRARVIPFRVEVRWSHSRSWLPSSSSRGPRRRAWALGGRLALVFVYGLSIVSLGWHYPSDVAAGWCVRRGTRRGALARSGRAHVRAGAGQNLRGLRCGTSDFSKIA